MFGKSVSHSPTDSKVLLLLFVLSLAASQLAVEQDTESHRATPWTLSSVPIPDFTVGVTQPSIVSADGTTHATSIILVSPLNGFTGTVALSDLPLPTDLLCTAIHPAAIPNSSGEATVSCSSSVPGAYDVTIFGTSGGIRHSATATFTFTTSAPPDFTIAAVSSVSLTADTTATSNVTVTPQGGFHSEVNLTATVYPSTWLSVSLVPRRLVLASGTTTAKFSASRIRSSGTSPLTCNGGRPGEYTITIKATGGTGTHTATVNVHVATLSPAAPAPSTILGLAPAFFYVIIAGIIAVVAAGAVLLLRRRGSWPTCIRRGLFFPGAHLLINHMSMHREGVLFKHLQLALDPVLGA